MSDDKPDTIPDSEADTAAKPTDAANDSGPTLENKLTDLMAGDAAGEGGSAMPSPSADIVAAAKAAAEREARAAAGEDAPVEAPAESGNADVAEPAPEATQPATPDLDAEALRAAEQALSEGEAALASAKSALEEGVAQPATAPQPQTEPASGAGRELALRLLLAVNVVAMVIVAMLPGPAEQSAPVDPVTGSDPVVSQPAPTARRFNEPWNKALDAAERREFGAAVTILEGYLADNPRMAPSQRLSTLMALSHYAASNNDFKLSEDYRRRANAIEQSHALPEDLVAMAKAAAESGDQASLRRIWAQFLLQQRQIPTWLEKHVAEAYLQLGDSYRTEADTAAEAARRAELAEAAEMLRQEALREERDK